MSGGDFGRQSESVREGIGVNDNTIKQLKLINECLNELRLIRAHMECITQEQIQHQDLYNDYN